MHACHWLPAAAAVPACVTMGIPLIDGSIRMGSVPRARASASRHHALRGARRREQLCRSGGVADRSEKGRVIYNAFDDEHLLGASPWRFAATDGDPSLSSWPLVPHRLTTTPPSSGQHACLRTGSARWRFLLVGDGPERPALLAQAAELVSAGVVAFPARGLRSSTTFVVRMSVF